MTKILVTFLIWVLEAWIACGISSWLFNYEMSHMLAFVCVAIFNLVGTFIIVLSK